MTFDSTRYRQEVLEPAHRNGDRPPADLFVRYGLANDANLDDAAFSAHIDQVANHWRTLQNRSPLYSRLVGALLREHATLDRSDKLNRKAFADAQREGRQKTVQALRRWIDDVGPVASCVSTEAVRQWSADAGIPVDTALRTLRHADITVADPIELPDAPPHAMARNAVAKRDALGLPLTLAEVDQAVVTDGFRVVGQFRPKAVRLDAAAVQAALDALARQRRVDGIDTRKSLLKAISVIIEAGKLHEFVLWELRELLARCRSGMTTQKVLAREARQLGVADADADVLAMSVIEGGGAGGGGKAAEIEAALAEGRLRDAEHLVLLLDSDEGAEVRSAVERVRRQVDDQIAAARSAADGEQRARHLADALALSGDDATTRALASVAPPPPSGLRAVQRDGTVTLQWTAGVQNVGTAHYRIVRQVGAAPRTPGDGAVVAETSHTDATEQLDTRAAGVLGRRLHYAVFARRVAPDLIAADDAAWSTGAHAPPVVVAPPVDGVSLTCDGWSVTGVWTLPADGCEVRVTRTGSGRGRSDVRASATGFLDRDVQAGAQYDYAVTAVYRHDHGDAVESAPRTASIVVEAPPSPIRDLQVVVEDEHGRSVADISWPVVASGDAAIFVAPEPGAVQEGRSIAASELSVLGERVVGRRHRAGDREHLRAALRPGRCHLTAVTVGRSSAVVGASRTVRVSAPITGLRAERRDDTVQLSWFWPPASTVARVSWRAVDADAQDGRRLVCHLAEYRERGGLEIPVDRRAHVVSVEADIEDATGTISAAGVSVTVPALAVPVRYALHRRGRKLRVTFESGTSCVLPRTVVVFSAGAVMPLDVSQGQVICEVAADDGVALDPDAPHEVVVRLPRRERGWIRCFATSQDITLIDPPTQTMKVA